MHRHLTPGAPRDGAREMVERRRVRSFAATGIKPFIAFTAGVAVNIAIGYALSAHVFAPYWNSLGQGT